MKSPIIVLSQNDETAVCPNFKTAYRVALTLAKIAKPNLTYRQALSQFKINGGNITLLGESQIAIPVVLIQSKLIK